MFKAKDGTEKPGYDVVAERPESVVAGGCDAGPERAASCARRGRAEAILPD